MNLRPETTTFVALAQRWARLFECASTAGHLIPVCITFNHNSTARPCRQRHVSDLTVPISN